MATFLHIAKQQNYNAIFNELVNRHPTLDDIIPYSMEIFKSHSSFTSFNQTDFQNTFINIATNPNCTQEYSVALCLYAELIRSVINRKSLLNTAVSIANRRIKTSSSEGSVRRSCQFGIPGDECTEGMTHEIYLKNKILKERDSAFIKMLSKNWGNAPLSKYIRGNRRTKVFELCQNTDYDYAISIIFDSAKKTMDFSDEDIRINRHFEALDKSEKFYNPNDSIISSQHIFNQKIEIDHTAFSSLIKDIRNMPKYWYNQTELDSAINCICQLLPQLYKQIPELYTLHSHPETAQEIYERALSQRRPTKPAIAEYTRDAFPEFADILEGHYPPIQLESNSEHSSPSTASSDDDDIPGLIVITVIMLLLAIINFNNENIVLGIIFSLISIFCAYVISENITIFVNIVIVVISLFLAIKTFRSDNIIVGLIWGFTVIIFAYDGMEKIIIKKKKRKSK